MCQCVCVGGRKKGDNEVLFTLRNVGLEGASYTNESDSPPSFLLHLTQCKHTKNLKLYNKFKASSIKDIKYQKY